MLGSRRIRGHATRQGDEEEAFKALEKHLALLASHGKGLKITVATATGIPHTDSMGTGANADPPWLVLPGRRVD